MVTMTKIPDCDSLFELIYPHAHNSCEESVMVQLQLLGRFRKMEIALLVYSPV